jgi:hypothetical protein
VQWASATPPDLLFSCFPIPASFHEPLPAQYATIPKQRQKCEDIH